MTLDARRKAAVQRVKKIPLTGTKYETLFIDANSRFVKYYNGKSYMYFDNLVDYVTYHARGNLKWIADIKREQEADDEWNNAHAVNRIKRAWKRLTRHTRR